jgi:Ca2+-binding EF-hand superfamily protein
MKIKIATIILAVCAMVFANAQQQDVNPSAKIQLLKQFDKDGDGVLNKDEREAARSAVKEKKADLQEMRKRHAKDVIKRFDKDGDGKLSEDELTIFLEEQRKMFDKMRNKHQERMMRNIPKDILAKYDKDGDGKQDAPPDGAVFDARAKLQHGGRHDARDEHGG